MAVAEHKPDCPSLTAKKPFWWHFHLSEDGHSMFWRGPEPKWEPPKCDGCNPESDRALFARMAEEVAHYQQETL